MAKRHKRWARRQRRALMELLGDKCRRCGTEDNLEFDCIIPQGHEHHTYDTSHRMSFYRKQHRMGNLQILCEECNSKKGSKEDKVAYLSFAVEKPACMPDTLPEPDILLRPQNEADPF